MHPEDEESIRHLRRKCFIKRERHFVAAASLKSVVAPCRCVEHHTLVGGESELLAQSPLCLFVSTRSEPVVAGISKFCDALPREHECTLKNARRVLISGQKPVPLAGLIVKDLLVTRTCCINVIHIEDKPFKGRAVPCLKEELPFSLHVPGGLAHVAHKYPRTCECEHVPQSPGLNTPVPAGDRRSACLADAPDEPASRIIVLKPVLVDVSAAVSVKVAVEALEEHEVLPDARPERDLTVKSEPPLILRTEEPLLFLFEPDLPSRFQSLSAVSVRKREQDPASSPVGNSLYNAYVNRSECLLCLGCVTLRKCGTRIESGGRIVTRQDLFKKRPGAFDELRSSHGTSSFCRKHKRCAELSYPSLCFLFIHCLR